MPVPLDQEIKVRVSTATKERLLKIAEQGGEGKDKISDVIREAINRYLERQDSLGEPGASTSAARAKATKMVREVFSAKTPQIHQSPPEQIAQPKDPPRGRKQS